MSKVRTSKDIQADIDQTLATVANFNERNRQLEQLMADKWDVDTTTEESEYAALAGKLKAADVRLERLQGELQQAMKAEFTAHWTAQAKSGAALYKAYRVRVDEYDQAVQAARNAEESMRTADQAFAAHMRQMDQEHLAMQGRMGVAPIEDFTAILKEHLDLGVDGIPQRLLPR